jgi:hypothetical protein
MIYCLSCGKPLKNMYEGAQHIMFECIVMAKSLTQEEKSLCEK